MDAREEHKARMCIGIVTYSVVGYIVDRLGSEQYHNDDLSQEKKQ